MPALNLSPITRSGLVILRDLPENNFGTLPTDLEGSLESLQSRQSLSPANAELLKDAIDALYGIRVYNEVPLEEFTVDVLDSLEYNQQLSSSAVEAMRGRLLQILDIPALRVAAKAALLHQEHERTYCTARILTDVRPVYDNGVNVPPSGAIITHTLKISYHESEGGDIHEIFVAMGTRDLYELQEVLVRANDKATRLRGVLEAGKLRYIDPQQ